MLTGLTTTLITKTVTSNESALLFKEVVIQCLPTLQLKCLFNTTNSKGHVQSKIHTLFNRKIYAMFCNIFICFILLIYESN